MVGVVDWWVGGFACHVPGAAGDFFAIDVAADAIGFTEGVGDGDVVPFGACGEAVFGGPAVVGFVAVWAAAAEEEGGAGFAGFVFEAEGPVLVFWGVCGGFVAAFADDVDVAAVGDIFGLDPGFDGDGVALFEAEVVVGEVAFFDLDGAVGVVEGGGVVIFFEGGVDGWLWSGGCGFGFIEEGAGFFLVEGPFDDWGDFGDDDGVVVVGGFCGGGVLLIVVCVAVVGGGCDRGGGDGEGDEQQALGELGEGMGKGGEHYG